MNRIPGALLGLMLLAGCAGNPPPGEWVRTELYFGQMDHGKAIAREDWEKFLTDEVTPRFPNGLTVYEARGQWLGVDGKLEREPSMVIVLFHSRDPGDEKKIEELRGIYKKRFNQDAVMRTDSGAKVGF